MSSKPCSQAGSQRAAAAALAAAVGLSACVTNPTRPAASGPADGAQPSASAVSAAPSCERLPTTSNQQKVVQGAAIGGFLGGVIGAATGNKSRHVVNGVLGGALVGALAGSAFKNEIDVQEMPDGSVKLKLPGALLFASGQHSLSPAFQSTLASVTQTLKKYCDVTVRVVGHTDSQGAAAANQQLSERRARAVVEQMAGSGYNRAYLQSDGRGANEPIAANTDEAGRQANRRVELFARPPAS